jgi:phosphatidylserine/phosphatidylglycerophosphate/cardiolipin synthase-like enzyme
MSRLHTILSAADHLVGDNVERLFVAHHERRLRRLDQTHALHPLEGSLWVPGDPPPREGTSIDVLIDGAAALPRIAAALQHARSHVLIAGWSITADFALVRDGERLTVRNLLADLAAHGREVRVLLWAGPPLPLFKPSRPDVRRQRDALIAGTRVKCALDAHERPLHTHHEKLVVIDDEVAFVGGIDLTDLPTDRYDSPEHRLRDGVGWHDVVTELRGPIVADVAEHLQLRWHAVTGERLPTAPPPSDAGPVTAQLVSTIPEHIYDAVPMGRFRILEAYVRALRSAERFIYIENQFIWSSEIVAVLRDKLLHPPSDAFRLLLVLPARPNSGRDNTLGQLGVLAEADRDAGRFLACTIYSRESGREQPIYVHAKVAVVDDRWLTVGSANLNDHSLFNDTEVNVVTSDEALARTTRRRLWSEHLERPIEELGGDPTALIDEVWKPIASEQFERRQAGEPMTHRLTRLPHVSHRSKRLLGPMQSIIFDG